MQSLYNTAIQVFIKGIKLAALFQPKAKKAIEGRQNWKKVLAANISPNENWIWMHCSSLGEFEQGRPIFDQLKQVFPNHKLALSFFSPSGYEIRKDYPQADYVFYLPFDTPNNAKTLAKILQPEFLILVKYDYWFNHLQAQQAIGTKTIAISAIFRSNQMYFKNYGKWMAKQLRKNLNHFFVQDQTSQNLLQSIGINAATISGDTRFDRVKNIAQNTKPLDWVLHFKGDKKLCVIGSSWPKDEKLWATFVEKHSLPEWKFIFVPHEVNQAHIHDLQQTIKDKSILYSHKTEADLIKHNILIVDTIGLLSQIYASADLAYVGGGFKSSGVHNTLEPAVFGIPVVIGPNYQKFNEVKLLKEEGVVFPISDYTSFEQIIHYLMEDEQKRNQIQQLARQVFQKQLPSTEIILNYLRQNKVNDDLDPLS